MLQGKDGTTFTITYKWRSSGSGSDYDYGTSTRGKATNAAGKSGRWILEGGGFTEDNGTTQEDTCTPAGMRSTASGITSTQHEARNTWRNVLRTPQHRMDIRVRCKRSMDPVTGRKTFMAHRARDPHSSHISSGTGNFSVPHICDWYYQYQFNKAIAAYDRFQGIDCEGMIQEAREYNEKTCKEKEEQFLVPAEEREELDHLLDPWGTGMMGYVDIPKIGVHIPIYHGTEERALQSGAGFWYGTSLPVGGENTHCVLAAHNGLVKAKLFTGLDNWKWEIVHSGCLKMRHSYEVESDPRNTSGRDGRTLYPERKRPCDALYLYSVWGKYPQALCPRIPGNRTGRMMEKMRRFTKSENGAFST